MKRILLVLVALALIVVGGLAVFIYSVARGNVPEYQARLLAPALADSVNIHWDQRGVPHIFAAHEMDALFALGWLHASERFFQMDLTRRFAQGRLSELLGSLTLGADKDQRRIGHSRLARAALPNLKDNDRKRLQAYADGINFWLENAASSPFEYYILRAETEPWNVYDLLTVQSFQSWYSDALQNKDDFLLHLYRKVGADTMRQLPIFYPEDAPYTLPREALSMLQDPRRYFAEKFINGFLPPLMTRASNAWVVAPSKSGSGKAMLASDPHLQINRLPQFWFFCGIHVADSIRAMGVTTPGLPFIVMGNNGRAAWAFTAGGVDISEYYEEQLNPADSLQYRVGNSWQRFELIEETIVVAGESVVKDTVLLSRHGPLMFRHNEKQVAYTMHWAGFDADLSAAVSSGFALWHVEEIEQFRKIVSRFGALNANWVYADSAGNIGYQLGTPLPIRPHDYRNLPVEGKTIENYWTGYRPLEETPFSVNPARGWLATANNKAASPEILGYDIPGQYFNGRINRLYEWLDNSNKMTVEDFKKMQADVVDAVLRDWQKELPWPKDESSSDLMLLRSRLQNWDGTSDLESYAAAFMNLFERTYTRDLFEDEFGGFATSIPQRWALNVFRQPGSLFHDDTATASQESREDMLLAVFDSLRSDGEPAKWGEIQQLRMAHPLAQVPGLAFLLSLEYGPWPWPGTENTLNASFSSYNRQSGKFNVMMGPSWRYIVDFINPQEALMILPSGNSGHPQSPFFMNMFDDWKSGNYHRVSLDKTHIKNNTAFITTLTPVENKDEKN